MMFCGHPQMSGRHLRVAANKYHPSISTQKTPSFFLNCPSFLKTAMSYFRILLSTIISVTTLTTFSQKKELTQDQLLKNKLPAITKPLPLIVSWETDDKLIIGRKLHPDSVSTPMLVDLKSGKETIAAKQDRKPDTSKRVYARDADIYFKDGDKAEVRLTNNNQAVLIG